MSPLGNTADKLWAALSTGQSGVRELTSLPVDALPTRFGAEAREFTGAIEDFGPLDKLTARTIKKNLKVMCREMQMGIAVAQLALADSKLPLATTDRDRVGVVYGADYMITLPDDFAAGNRNCVDAAGQFEFGSWGESGLPAVEPLWLLKYLPNLPAAHIAIFNDLRGPNNSITMREASGNLAISEAYRTIVRGHADAMLAGATGTKIHTFRTIHMLMQREIAGGDGDPACLSRPFDRDRRGEVLGEGAAAIFLEELASAQARGATILGEVVGCASSAAVDSRGVGLLQTAIRNVLVQSLASANVQPEDIGHIHAHGCGGRRSDAEEAQAIAEVFAGRKSPVPVAAAKSYFGNLGAASGVVELIGSLLAQRHGELFKTLNYDTPDPECPLHVVANSDRAPPGESFINLNVSPQGQAAAVVVKRFA